MKPLTFKLFGNLFIGGSCFIIFSMLNNINNDIKHLNQKLKYVNDDVNYMMNKQLIDNKKNMEKIKEKLDKL